MNKTILKDLIHEVLWLSAEGKVRKYYMEHNKFKDDYDAMIFTFVALAKTNKEEDRIKVWSEEYETWNDYSIKDYKVPTNIALFNVLSSTDCIYTTEWMRRAMRPCGKRLMDMNLTLEEKKKVLTPKDLEDIYALMELTAPLSWNYGPVVKQPIMLNDVKYWGQLEERKFTINKYFNSKGEEVAPDDDDIVKVVPQEKKKSIYSLYETEGQLISADVAAAVQYGIETFDVNAFYDRREVIPTYDAIKRALAMRTNSSGVQAIADIKKEESQMDISNNSIVTDDIMSEVK